MKEDKKIEQKAIKYADKIVPDFNEWVEYKRVKDAYLAGFMDACISNKEPQINKVK